jgi:hypothetical protein
MSGARPRVRLPLTWRMRVLEQGSGRSSVCRFVGLAGASGVSGHSAVSFAAGTAARHRGRIDHAVEVTSDVVKLAVERFTTEDSGTRLVAADRLGMCLQLGFE